MELNNNQSNYSNLPYQMPANTAAQNNAQKKPEDTVYTKTMKKQFPLFALGSSVYAFFYAFCLYKNASGITYPFFVIGTLMFFFFSMQKLGVPYKKDSIFYIISIVLLGVSNCLTASPQILLINKCGIFLLFFFLMLHTVYNDKSWNLPKYFGSLFHTLGTCICCLAAPITDMVSYFDACKQEKANRSQKSESVFYALIGVVIAVPVLLIAVALLCKADAVFSNMFEQVILSINFSTILGVLFLVIAVFFCAYAICSALCMKRVKEEVKDSRTLNPIIAIVATVGLAAVYLIFSVIQIFYLFIGNLQLPAGYTYSSYAREGFFQLLAVCILNLLLVLVCLHLFRENAALKVILTIICGCTYIMILSSALRMIMYITRYNLTFLRILVLWALAVIFLLMTGVTIFIYNKKFPLFLYGTAVVTVFYIALSFSHPDYWIASYNLNPAHQYYLDNYDLQDSARYLSRLSSDAAPVILNPEKNPYFTSVEDVYEKTKDISDYYNDYSNNYLWLRRYCDKVRENHDQMHLRSRNFSIYTAGKYMR